MLIGIVIGVLVGVPLGVLIICLCQTAAGR